MSDTTTTSSVYFCTVTLDTCTASTGTSIVYYPRRVLVTLPKQWRRKKAVSFAKFINETLQIEWVIDSLIFGEVMVLNPNVEQKTFTEFIEMLKWRQSSSVICAIDEFLS